MIDFRRGGFGRGGGDRGGRGGGDRGGRGKSPFDIK